MAALGDSITAGSPLWDPDPGTRSQIAEPDERSQFQYWAAGELERVEFRNCGVFGERTDEIAERLGQCADGADALIVQGGINDIAQNRPVADTAEDLRSMVRAGLDAGLDVYLVNVLPWNNGFPGARKPILELNGLIDRIGADEEVPMLDFYSELEDPQSPALIGPQLTDDGDHPSIEGYRRLGGVVAQGLG